MSQNDRSVFAAVARLAAVAAMIALVLPAMVNGSMTQSGLFAGFAGAALIGIFQHGVFKPLGMFERFLLIALTGACFVGLVPWLTISGSADTALRDGQLCANGWSNMATGFTAFLVALGVVTLGFSGELIRSRHIIIAASPPETNPPRPLWLVLALLLFCLGLMIGVAITLNQMTCDASFDPLSIVLPVTVAFSVLMVAGYLTIASIHRARLKSSG